MKLILKNNINLLYHFLSGWFGNNDSEINNKYRTGIANWIYNCIISTKNVNASNIKFSFLWYKMIYCITNTEKEAWELFFKHSSEFLNLLEKENYQLFLIR